MKHTVIGGSKSVFKPLLASSAVQAALMILSPGESSSEKPMNEHPKCEQWIYVISGTGRAKGNARAITLKPGSLLLIERREVHQIVNNGSAPLVTVNFYAPPAYTPQADVKRAAKVL